MILLRGSSATLVLLGLVRALILQVKKRVRKALRVVTGRLLGRGCQYGLHREVERVSLYLDYNLISCRMNLACAKG